MSIIDDTENELFNTRSVRSAIPRLFSRPRLFERSGNATCGAAIFCLRSRRLAARTGQRIARQSIISRVELVRGPISLALARGGTLPILVGGFDDFMTQPLLLRAERGWSLSRLVLGRSSRDYATPLPCAVVPRDPSLVSGIATSTKRQPNPAAPARQRNAMRVPRCSMARPVRVVLSVAPAVIARPTRPMPRLNRPPRCVIPAALSINARPDAGSD
jgi:hypothetical protein